MATKFMAGKRIIGNKSDRDGLTDFNDSLESSADGSNSGIKNPNYSSNGLEFTGGEYVEVNGLRSTISGATSISMACWINPSDITDATILGFWNSGYEVIIFSINGSNKLQLVTKGADGNNLYMASSASISADTLTHVAFTYDTSGTDTVKLYINGALDSTHTTNVPTSFPSSSTGNVYIGSHSAGANYFDGTIKQYLVYSDVLTLSEIQTIYNSGTPVTSPSTSGLVSRYDFTANANDSQGSNNGTSSAIKLGTGAYEFDGTDDFVNLGTDSGLNLLNGGTVAMWVNTDNITDRRFAGKGSNGAWELLSETTDNKVKFRVNDGSVKNVIGTTALSDGTWYHIAGVYDKSAGEIRLYVNGTLENTTTGVGQIATINTATYLGRNEGGNYYDGKIDDVGIWDRVLTATEIGKLVNNNQPSPNITDSPAYTKVGTTVSASGTTIEATNCQSNQNPVHRVYKDIGSVSDSTFYFEFDYKQKQNTNNLFPIALQSGTGKTNIASEDMIYLKTDGLNMTIAKKNGGSNTNSSDGWITIVANTQYYCSITRSSNTASLKVYTDSGRSSNQVGGTKTVSVSDVSGLQYLHSESRGDGGGGTNIGWVLDNISLTNGATTKGSEGDAQLVSSLTDKSGLKAHYTMDTQGTQAYTGFTKTDDFNLSSYETQPRACTLSADGTYFYVVGDQGHSVDQFTMSTPYDLTTISHTRVQALGTNNPRGIYFKEDGTKMFVSYYGGTIKRYSLSTAWNVSTIGSADQSDTFESDSGDYNSVIGLFFKPDGTKFYTVVASDNAIKEYTCGSAWDVSSMSGSDTATRDSLQADPSGLFISSDGLRLWYCEYNTDKVYQWNLSTAWDISTGSIDSTSYSVEANPFGFTMKPDGTKFYLVNDGEDEIQEFTGGKSCSNNAVKVYPKIEDEMLFSENDTGNDYIWDSTTNTWTKII